MNEVPIFIEVCLCIVSGCVTAVVIAATIRLYMSLIEDLREQREEDAYMSLIEDWHDRKEQREKDEEEEK